MWLYLLHVVIGVSPFGFCNFGLETEDLYDVTSAMSQTVAFYNTVTKPTLYRFIYFTAIFSVKIQILLLIVIGKFCTDDMIDLIDTIANCCAQKSELHFKIRRLHICFGVVVFFNICVSHSISGRIEVEHVISKKLQLKRKAEVSSFFKKWLNIMSFFGGGLFLNCLLKSVLRTCEQ